MNPNILLCYEMNGAPLDAGHGAPLRLLAPGWYGVANVKWLDRIEVIDTRFAGHFMARDYVTIREEQRDGQTGLDRDAGGQGAAEVGAGPGDAQGRRLPDRRRGLGRPDRERRGPGRRRTVDAGHHHRGGRGPSSPGSSGRWPGRTRRPASTPITSRATDTAGNVQPATTDPRSRTRRPTGRATARSRAASNIA